MFVDLVYVDDILVTSANLNDTIKTKIALHRAFKIKDLAKLKYFLRIEFSRLEKRIVVHKRKYALKFKSKIDLRD